MESHIGPRNVKLHYDVCILNVKKKTEDHSDNAMIYGVNSIMGVVSLFVSIKNLPNSLCYFKEQTM